MRKTLEIEASENNSIFQKYLQTKRFSRKALLCSTIIPKNVVAIR